MTLAGTADDAGGDLVDDFGGDSKKRAWRTTLAGTADDAGTADHSVVWHGDRNGDGQDNSDGRWLGLT